MNTCKKEICECDLAFFNSLYNSKFDKKHKDENFNQDKECIKTVPTAGKGACCKTKKELDL